MRKMIALAALMLALSASVSAAAKGEFLMGGTGGLSLPTGDFGDLADSGWQGGVFGDYGVAENVSVGVSAIYHGFSVKDEIISDLGVDDISLTAIQFTGHLRYWFPAGEQMMPFLTAGGGIYNLGSKVELAGEEEEESESKGGFYGGAGLDFKAGPMWRVGFEGNYHYILDGALDSDGEETAANVFGITGRVSFTFANQTQ